MFFLPQSVARLPPIGFSYLEHLGSLIRAFTCKNSIFKPQKEMIAFSLRTGIQLAIFCLLCTPTVSPERAIWHGTMQYAMDHAEKW